MSASQSANKPLQPSAWNIDPCPEDLPKARAFVGRVYLSSTFVSRSVKKLVRGQLDTESMTWVQFKPTSSVSSLIPQAKLPFRMLLADKFAKNEFGILNFFSSDPAASRVSAGCSSTSVCGALQECKGGSWNQCELQRKTHRQSHSASFLVKERNATQR